MKRLCLFVMAVVFLVGATVYSSTQDEDFDGLVSDVAHRYAVPATRVPLMGLVSLCARFETHGGVKGLRIAEFENLHGVRDSSELTSLVRSHLGSAWQPFIHERGKQGESQSVIFVRPNGDAMKMMIADYSGAELNLVRMELSGDALADWMKHPDGKPEY